jgi:2-hydroxychromene-2-carboxylate isomerase
MTATDAVRVDLWFDPGCPWTWTTARWLVEHVVPARPVEVHWHLMSIALLNEGQPAPPAQARHLDEARRSGRLLAAAADRHGQQVLAPLYTALGTRLHRERRHLDAQLAAEALTEAGLDPALAAAVDDASFDDAVRASHERSQAAVGEPAGSPVLAVDGTASFGPVLSRMPRGQEALDLFDALLLLARVPSFSELKRARGTSPDAG